MKKLQKVRLKNKSLRDDINKMQGIKNVADQKLETLQAENEEKAHAY